MICIISVTEKGDVLARRIEKELGGDLYLKSEINDFKLNNIMNINLHKINHGMMMMVMMIGIGMIIRNLLHPKLVDKEEIKKILLFL